MDVSNSEPNPSEDDFHVHNYSLIAVKSIILEVKKYPIVYNSTTKIPFFKEIVDFAWARIVAELLDNNVNFDSAQRKYWERSFRELWKWIRSICKQDMIARRKKHIHVRNPAHEWLMYLKFLEPYITFDNQSSEDGPSANTHIQVNSSDVIIDKNYTVIWLRDISEPVDGEQTVISICFRNTESVSLDFNRQPSGIGVLHKLSNEYQPQMVIDKRRPAAFFNQLQLLSSCNQASESKGSAELESLKYLQQGGSPERFVDKDYKYVMSLLPILQQMEPKRKAEVKTLMIQDLHDVLDDRNG